MHIYSFEREATAGETQQPIGLNAGEVARTWIECVRCTLYVESPAHVSQHRRSQPALGGPLQPQSRPCERGRRLHRAGHCYLDGATCSLPGVRELNLPEARVARTRAKASRPLTTTSPPTLHRERRPALPLLFSFCLLVESSVVRSTSRPTHGTVQCRLERLLGRLGTRCHLRRFTTAFPALRRRRCILPTVLIVALFFFL